MSGYPLDVPDLWIHMAGLFGKDVVIAGGALRDLDNDRASQIKDIDIWVYDPQIPPVATNVDIYDILDYGRDRGIVWGAELTMPHFPFPINVLGLDQPRSLIDIVNLFDFGICQIGSLGDLVFASPAYVRDKENKTFTYLLSEDDELLKASWKRWRRLKEKYKGWTLIGLGKMSGDISQMKDSQ